MTVYEEIDKLATLQDKGILTEDEYLNQKEALLYPNIDPERKSRAGYVVFALFMGIFGAHNFYVGRWKRGLCQLLLTILTCFIAAIPVKIWAIVNIFTIKTDGKGRPFFAAKKSDYLWVILAYLCFWGMVIKGGIDGYRESRGETEDEALNYVMTVQGVARMRHNDFSERCANIIPMDDVRQYFDDCILYPEGNVELVNVKTTTREKLLQDSKIQQVGYSNLMIPAEYNPELND